MNLFSFFFSLNANYELEMDMEKVGWRWYSHGDGNEKNGLYALEYPWLKILLSISMFFPLFDYHRLRIQEIQSLTELKLFKISIKPFNEARACMLMSTFSINNIRKNQIDWRKKWTSSFQREYPGVWCHGIHNRCVIVCLCICFG